MIKDSVSEYFSSFPLYIWERKHIIEYVSWKVTFNTFNSSNVTYILSAFNLLTITHNLVHSIHNFWCDNIEYIMKTFPSLWVMGSLFPWQLVIISKRQPLSTLTNRYVSGNLFPAKKSECWIIIRLYKWAQFKRVFFP